MVNRGLFVMIHSFGGRLHGLGNCRGDCLKNGVATDKNKLNNPNQFKIKKQFNAIECEPYPFVLAVRHWTCPNCNINHDCDIDTSENISNQADRVLTLS